MIERFLMRLRIGGGLRRVCLYSLRIPLALVVMVLLGGCGDSDVYTPDEPVTIQFLQFGSADYYAPLIEEFESQHENVTVELRSGPFFGPDSLQEIDILMVNQNFLGQLIDEGMPISLNAFISEDEDFSTDDFYTGALEGLSVQGQIWAIPYMADMMVMYYNEDLFDKYGVPYPDAEWTWNDFLERAQKLTHEERGEYGYAPQQVGGGDALLETMILVYQYGGRLFDDLNMPERVVVNEPLNVQALQWYADLFHEYGVSPGPGKRQSPYPLAGIEGGKYAMWMGFFEDSWEGQPVAVAPLPRGNNAVTFGSVLGLMITSQADDPRACWEWVKFVTAAPPPALVPVRHSLLDSGVSLGGVPGASEAARAALPTMMVSAFNLQQGLFDKWGFVSEAYATALARIQEGESVQAALDEAQDAINANF